MNPLVTTGLDPRGEGTALSVNVNKIALLRNQRPLPIPSVVGLSRICLEAGAHGITVHPRPDERHIRRHDVFELAALLKDLKQDLMAVYDDTAAIGKLYRRQDEIGTPWCVTVDVDSIDDGAVTVRDRDTMTQERVPLEGVKRLILDRMAAVRP